MGTVMPSGHKTNIKSWLENSIPPPRAMAILSGYTERELTKQYWPSF